MGLIQLYIECQCIFTHCVLAIRKYYWLLQPSRGTTANSVESRLNNFYSAYLLLKTVSDGIGHRCGKKVSGWKTITSSVAFLKAFNIQCPFKRLYWTRNMNNWSWCLFLAKQNLYVGLQDTENWMLGWFVRSEMGKMKLIESYPGKRACRPPWDQQCGQAGPQLGSGSQRSPSWHRSYVTRDI